MPRNQTLSMFRECVEKLQKDDLPPSESRVPAFQAAHNSSNNS